MKKDAISTLYSNKEKARLFSSSILAGVGLNKIGHYVPVTTGTPLVWNNVNSEK
ncbi:hypothetical protein [Periweissella cryptocerci]|uniref:hypothetical protein n=1 Tax=Periweissella cryptocerci TaxID=2506420 RepID=UPI001404CC60|nr:hypothetical protein [Periweissella cryptocerci]